MCGIGFELVRLRTIRQYVDTAALKTADVLGVSGRYGISYLVGGRS